MSKCPVCGGVTQMGKAVKPKDNPTKPKENNQHCPRCNWAENRKKRNLR